MKPETRFSLKALVFSVIVIGALVAALYFMVIQAQDGVTALDGFLARFPLVPILLAMGVLAVLILWLLIHFSGRSAIRKAAAPPVKAEAAPRRESERMEKPAKTTAPPSPFPALQILSILQRQGRFIDFIEEDLSGYSDEQVGAAVRDIHRGCRDGLREHLEWKPIMEGEDGAQVTVRPGFDLESIRLTGNIAGDPPFKGVLRHRGWRVIRVDLPRPTREKDWEKDWVLSPAEVEIP